MALPEKHKREYRMSYIDARIDTTAGQPELVRIGNDNEDISRETSWDTTSTKVVTGVMTTSSTRGEESLTVEPYYVRRDEPLGRLLETIDEKELELDEIKRWYYEAKVDETGATLYAFKKMADVKPTSYGGSANDGDSIPFELTFSGEKIKQNFDFTTEIFTDVV